MFSWKWYLKDLKQNKPVTVFSTFSCGGGSSMGYKLAGFKLLGNVEIDPKINAIYKANHHPRFNFCMDLREFNGKQDIPPELFNLDILDGSPPCSTFSTAGQREKSWGKEKVFREGQKKQTLDDLFFIFLDTVAKLRPKIFVAENVTGLLKGNAKGYVHEIIKKSREIGYEVQLFKLNAARMECPQARERVFFIGNRMGYEPLKMGFDYPQITFGQVRSEKGVPLSPTSKYKKLLDQRRPTDRDLGDICLRVHGKESGFTNKILSDSRPALTITAGGNFFRMFDGHQLTAEDFRNVGTFPQDYDFGDQSPQYVTGMSVPPVMMAHIASQIWEQWLKKEKGVNE